jgi:hypothetical protein
MLSQHLRPANISVGNQKSSFFRLEGQLADWRLQPTTKRLHFEWPFLEKTLASTRSIPAHPVTQASIYRV